MSPEPKKRPPQQTRVIERVCVSVSEWCDSTNISRPTAYRMMADGRLRYVRLGERTRKIPTSEYVRLGLVHPSEEAAA
jgi:excisionase family DNA binding protein